MQRIHDKGSTAVRIACLLFAVSLLALLFPVIALMLAWEEYRTASFGRLFRRRHGPRIRGILVYSNSPNWKDYIEREWLPRLDGRLFVLNWSERNTWDRTSPLEAKMFRELGDREFNPAAIVLRPHDPGALFRSWGRSIRRLDPIGILAPSSAPADVVRFFKAFRDLKHGREHTLRAAERELWALLDDPEAPRVVA